MRPSPGERARQVTSKPASGADHDRNSALELRQLLVMRAHFRLLADTAGA
ncbi:MAG TPA: hypothetical protein VHU80_06705 [Polyangiaceae bacterium]|nr:hypothetical protein [Polyangiaceae bacterium]